MSGVVASKDQCRSQANRVWSASAHIDSISPQPSLQEEAIAAVKGEVRAIASDVDDIAIFLANACQLNLQEARSVSECVQEVLVLNRFPSLTICS